MFLELSMSGSLLQFRFNLYPVMNKLENAILQYLAITELQLRLLSAHLP